MTDPRTLPPLRPEIENRNLASGQIGEVERPLSAWERVTNIDWVRRLAILLVLAAAWEAYGRYLNNPLMVPPFSMVMESLWQATVNGPLVDRTFTSVRVLVIGYACGVALAAVFTALAVSTRVGTDLLSTLTAMFNPLPAIALLPIALLWFWSPPAARIASLRACILASCSANSFDLKFIISLL